MAFERQTAKFLTAFGRVFGVLCLIAAIPMFLGAALDTNDRAIFAAVGSILLIAGVAFLRIKPLDSLDIERFRSARK